MNNEIVLLLEALLSLGIAIFFVYLSKYRYCENKRYASKYENNKKMLIFRLIVTEILKWGSIVNITVRRSRQSGVARATCPD